MIYELVYSTGGHVGGFGDMLEAKTAALQRLQGDRTLNWVAIMTRSINSVEVARITREHLYIVVDELGKIRPQATAKMNVAIFTVEATVVLVGVSDAELNNSEVLHPDVLEKLRRDLAKGKTTTAKVTLEEVYET